MTENLAEECDITELLTKFERGLCVLRNATTVEQRAEVLEQLQDLNRKIAKAQQQQTWSAC